MKEDEFQKRIIEKFTKLEKQLKKIDERLNDMNKRLKEIEDIINTVSYNEDEDFEEENGGEFSMEPEKDNHKQILNQHKNIEGYI